MSNELISEEVQGCSQVGTRVQLSGVAEEEKLKVVGEPVPKHDGLDDVPGANEFKKTRFTLLSSLSFPKGE